MPVHFLRYSAFTSTSERYRCVVAVPDASASQGPRSPDSRFASCQSIGCTLPTSSCSPTSLISCLSPSLLFFSFLPFLLSSPISRSSVPPRVFTHRCNSNWCDLLLTRCCHPISVATSWLSLETLETLANKLSPRVQPFLRGANKKFVVQHRLWVWIPGPELAPDRSFPSHSIQGPHLSTTPSARARSCLSSDSGAIRQRQLLAATARQLGHCPTPPLATILRSIKNRITEQIGEVHCTRTHVE
ncbi:hypothetical protein F4823DRAFT_442341 [Ustulina deusta]|nr:hypothetical protein F4823DRAFT_442341 [Ustulina deusta]